MKKHQTSLFLPCSIVKHGICYQNVCLSVMPVSHTSVVQDIEVPFIAYDSTIFVVADARFCIKQRHALSAYKI